MLRLLGSFLYLRSWGCVPMLAKGKDFSAISYKCISLDMYIRDKFNILCQLYLWTNITKRTNFYVFWNLCTFFYNARVVYHYFLSTIVADHSASAILFPSTFAVPLYFHTLPWDLIVQFLNVIHNREYFDSESCLIYSH